MTNPSKDIVTVNYSLSKDIDVGICQTYLSPLIEGDISEKQTVQVTHYKSIIITGNAVTPVLEQSGCADVNRHCYSCPEGPSPDTFVLENDEVIITPIKTKFCEP